MRRPGWQKEGHEPDYRFSLVNERTFLAWMRTAFALLASAVLLDQVGGLRFSGQTYMPYLAVLASIPSSLLSVFAFRRWKANEIAMHHRKFQRPSSAAG
jgi:putative membrane protein